MKIGITISLDKNLFSSGINQNAFYLSILFCEAGHECILLGQLPLKDGKKQDIKKGITYKQLQMTKGPYNIEMQSFDDSENDYFDVVVILGLNMNSDRILNLKKVNPKIKFVHYQCGNQFLIDMEAALFGSHSAHFGKKVKLKSQHDNPETRFDAVWQIPQMNPTNWSWTVHTMKTENVTVVPFVWDPIFIEENFKHKGYGVCKPNKDFTKVGIMEPNLSVMKNFLIPLAVCERVNKEISKVKIYAGARAVKENIRARQLIVNTELADAGKLHTEKRHTTPDILSKWSHTIVSWQWTNPLNYLYFDIAWMGYPIIHNAHLCKDVGYYYKDVDIIEAGEKVKWVIDNHGDSEYLVDYILKNRKAIKRFTKENKTLIKQYDMLLQDLVTDKFQKYNYDEELNLIYKK